MMDRHYPPQPSYSRTNVPVSPKTLSKKSSVSTILESAKRANPVKLASSSSHVKGPLHGNTLNSRTPAHSSASAYILPSSALDGPPVEPSLFAYSSSTSPSRYPKKLHDSGASIQSTRTTRDTRAKGDERAIVRNARGEIEWRHAPQIAGSTPPSSHTGPPPRPARRSPLPPADPAQSRSRSHSNGPPRRELDERPLPPQPGVATSSANHTAPPQRPDILRRQSTDDAEGFETADEDDIEAREWERKRELQMEADRLEVYRRQLAQQDGERKIRSKASRDRLEADAAHREKQSVERRQAEQEARRLAREEKRRQEKDERRQKEKEEAQRRRMEAERAAEQERIRKKKEAEQKEIRRKQKEAEERKRKEEEAIKKAEAEAKRKEDERLAAIKAAQDAVLEKERRLVEAKRQVEEEDAAARKAGRRQERRMKRALAAGFPPGYIDPTAPPSDGEDDEDVFQAQNDSDAGSEVFVDAGADDDAEAKSATTGGSLARSASNRDAPSSTDGSSDMPGTPSDDKSISMLTPSLQWSNVGHGQVKFAAGTNGGPTPQAHVPQQMVLPLRFDRFRHAVKIGARRAPSKVEEAATTSTSLLAATFAATDDEDSADFDEDSSEIVKPKGPYREGGITYGRGWCAHGLADPSLVIDHRRYVNVNRTNLQEGYTIHYIDQVMYSDLPELVFSATTPDVIARLISHLDYADVKALRQTSKSIRFAVGQPAGREVVLSRFLAPVGYEPWKPAPLPMNAEGPVVEKDPFPLSFADCEGFLLSFDLQCEYARAGAEFARAPHKVDPRYPQIARATTRAYNRVLTRLRMQPNYHVPSSAKPHSPAAGSQLDMSVAMTSPWKPGRAGVFRVWVPCSGGAGWLSDAELARCERELFIGGVWPHLKKGDIVWDTAVGDERNEGKYVFDGHYLRDLSVMFDRFGHLPSWLNGFAYAPSYYHNVIRSSEASEPVVYLDVLPWRDQIVSTMRLVQDQVETVSAAGARYRISKWLYRAVMTITPGAIISDEGVQVVDAGWHGKVVIETEGTAEHAKVLISRCTGPTESVQTKAKLLASIMAGDANTETLLQHKPTTLANKIETTSPWAIVRARSRPGLIWIRPLDMRHRVVF